MWRIYYAGGSMLDGHTAEDWSAAPDDGVQVVVLFTSVETPRWHYSGGAVRDRQMWTGEDNYDPFGWGAKRGALISDADYFAIWERACADPTT
jgi:hypothetical protein